MFFNTFRLKCIAVDSIPIAAEVGLRDVVAVLPWTLLVYAIVGTVTAVMAVVAWRQRPSPGAETLGLVMAAAATWNLGLLLLNAPLSYWPFFLSSALVLTSAAVSVAAFFAFTLEYTGREQYLARPYVYLIVFEPVAIAMLALTNHLHWFVWEDVERATAASGYDFAVGPGLTAHLVFTYLLMTVGIILVISRLFRSRAVHRRQTLAILIGALAPWFGNMLYFVTRIETTQVAGFAVTGVVAYLALTKYRLIDLTPVARSTVMDALDVGVVVLDQDDRVTDINPFATRLFDVDDSVIGSEVSDVLEGVPDLCAQIETDTVFETSVTLTVDDTEHTISARCSRLTDALGRDVGRLLLLEDVTDERERQVELASRNEQLQEFASMVSHDIRNPLDVASGYVELMRQTRAPGPSDAAVSLETDRLDETADALGRIETIVDDVLTLAREGQAATNPERVSLRSTARLAWEHVVTVDARLIVGTDVQITADRDQLERLFENLFRNAVEHGGSEVTVTVGLLEDDETKGFYVADDGPGIPAEFRDEIFESGVTSEAGGTGFGLAIVDELVEAHGWDVTVTESDDGGAQFEFTGVELAGASIPNAET